MSKIEKLIEKLLAKPRDFTWGELIKVLSHFGYIESNNGKTSGSRRRFADKENNIITLHKPHPNNTLKPYCIKDVVEHLIERGKIKK